MRTGRIEVVNFRKYVVTVMGKEWPAYLPLAVVEAGAVAVKQYGWYHAVYTNRRAGGRCFDVKDGTGDQLYKPGRSRIRPDHHRALDTTWNVSLRKSGRFFMTGYRRGERVNCGRDATGYKLFARSATQCAYKGHGWRQLLRTYYGPGLEFVGGGASQTPDSQAPDLTDINSTDIKPADTTAGTLPQQTVDDRTNEPPDSVNGNVGFFGSTTGGLADALEALNVVVL